MNTNFNDTDLTIAQFSDCHLFSDIKSLHHNANVYQNLTLVLAALAKDKTLNVIVFTGDLSQDHSEQSYQHFVSAVEHSNISIPIYYLAGNHDEYKLLDKHLTKPPFVSAKNFENNYWQVFLVDSKSDSPAGIITQEVFKSVEENINSKKKQLLFSHHHPIDVGYFIDKHGIQNKQEFWHNISKYGSINAIACGHVHQAITLTKHLNQHKVQLFTCPATSIQFDPTADSVKALPINSAKKTGQGIGYRRFTLQASGNLLTSLHFSMNTLTTAK